MRAGKIAVWILAVFHLVSRTDAHDISLKPAKDLVSLQAQIADMLKIHHVPGAGIAIFDRDQILWTGEIGLANVAQKEPVTQRTLFRAGSVTKSFVAVALLQLVEQGKLDLNAPVRSIAPEIQITNAWEPADPVRVVHVLEHTAGFDAKHSRHSHKLHD